MGPNGNRDIIVIGASLGGVQALRELAGQLPADLPAAVLVAQHRTQGSAGMLALLLERRGPLPAVMAEDHMELRRGRIYVAPPDRHMILTRRGVAVAFGPRENRCRPAIDPLFRTAAVNYRSRVIGVILTGLLDDGAAGLLAVERCGGVALVQAPGDAAFPEMPRQALLTVNGARPVPLAELGTVLAGLAREPAPEPPPVPETLRLEAELTESAMMDEDREAVPSRPTTFTCPECNGAIREVDEGGLLRYRCRGGHALTSESLVAAKDDAASEALWLALQTLHERAQMLERMARAELERGRERLALSFQECAREADRHAQKLREFVARLKP